MKRSATPAIVLGVLCLAFLGFLAWSSSELPNQVAIHFGFNGYPDRWTDRSSALALTGGFGVALPLLLAAFSFAIRLFPISTINIPNREYWLAPEHRQETYAFFSRHMFWLACMVVCLMAGMQWLTIQANNSIPVRMPTGQLLIMLGAFLAGMAVWVVILWLHFRHPVSDS